MTSIQAERPRTTPFELIGGREAVSQFVERFYDLMEQEPEYAELRAMHAADLAPMRASLTGFLTAWLGGPRDWFSERPGACVVSAHRSLSITAATAAQWKHAMSRAVSESAIDPELGGQMCEAFARMADGMTGR